MNFTFRSSGPVSFGYSELENNNAHQASILTDFASQTTPGVDRSSTTLRNELKTSPDANQISSPMKTCEKLFIWGPFSYWQLHDEMKSFSKNAFSENTPRSCLLNTRTGLLYQMAKKIPTSMMPEGEKH